MQSLAANAAANAALTAATAADATVAHELLLSPWSTAFDIAATVQGVPKYQVVEYLEKTEKYLKKTEEELDDDDKAENEQEVEEDMT